MNKSLNNCIWFHLLIKSSSTLACPPAYFLQVNFFKNLKTQIVNLFRVSRSIFSRTNFSTSSGLEAISARSSSSVSVEIFRMIMVMMKTEPAGKGKIHRSESIIGEWFFFFKVAVLWWWYGTPYVLLMFQIIDVMKCSFLKTPTCFGCVPIGSQVGSFQVNHHVKRIISVFRIFSVFCISDFW